MERQLQKTKAIIHALLLITYETILWVQKLCAIYKIVTHKIEIITINYCLQLKIIKKL